jgi:hypothetical protein
MSDRQGHISLAFLLALSAATAPNAGVAAVDPTAEPLKPGNMRHLLKQNEIAAGDRVGDVRDDQGFKQRMAQGCWYNYWRRC